MCYLPKDHYKNKGEWTIDSSDHDWKLGKDWFGMKKVECKNCKIKLYPQDEYRPFEDGAW